MFRTLRIRLAHIFLLAILLTACGKKAADEKAVDLKAVDGKAVEVKAVDEIDFGAFTQSVYRNNYFGLSVTLPADWIIQDQDAQDRMMKAGVKMVTGDDKNLQLAVKASELNVVNLFSVFNFPVGSPVEFNPSIMAVAENMRQFPGIKSGKDYLFHARKLLESSQVKVTFPKEVYPQKLGGVDFDVMAVKIAVGNLVVKQNYYVAIIKGYALGFIISHNTDEELATLQKILDSVTFKP